jgi:hypothetical protein
MANTSQEVRDRVRGEQLLQLEKEGRAPHPDSPSGRSLLASYKRWQAGDPVVKAEIKELAALRQGLAEARDALQQAAATVKATAASPTLAAPAVKEEAAQALAEAKMRSILLAGGTSVAKAIEAGYAVYRLEGGQATFAAWKKAMAIR